VTGDVAGALSALPSIPKDREGPVFQEPWEAQAFALAVSLHGRGLFSWAEWADALAAEIRAAHSAGDPDTGETYYVHWLAALERLVVRKGAATTQALDERRDAWDRAARATPHGLPITLDADPARHGTRD
jgi:nitrile hydratase accessory protein